MKLTIRLVLSLVVVAFATACMTVPTKTKVEVKGRLVSQSQKNASYLKLAQYWDDHAEKQTIDFKGASYLTIWENEGKAEITIGNGPYYGMIELVRLDEKTTLIKCYAWGGMAKRILKWKDLIENAPEE